MTAEQVARRYYQLFNERLFDQAAALVDRQAVFHYLPTLQKYSGQDGYRAIVAAWVHAFEDARLEIQSLVMLNDHLVQVECLGRGTHTGELVLGQAIRIPATGRTAELAFQNLFEIRGGVIVTADLDFDVEDLKRRLCD